MTTRAQRNPADVELRPVAEHDSMAELTGLLHRAYARLADMGLRYKATYQSEAVTHQRIAQGECYVAVHAGALVGTIVFKPKERAAGSAWLDRPDIAMLAQFGVDPAWQAVGLGTRLMDLVERRAAQTGAAEIALDTAEPATHLVQWYARRGYRFIEHVTWQHANYRSVIMSKLVASLIAAGRGSSAGGAA